MIGNQVQVNQMWGMSENGVRITEKGRPQGRERQKNKNSSNGSRDGSKD